MRNAARDREVTRTLRKAGWRVLRVWECALTRQHSGRTAARVARALVQGCFHLCRRCKGPSKARSDLAPKRAQSRREARIDLRR